MPLLRKALVQQYWMALTWTKTKPQVSQSQMVLAAPTRQGATRSRPTPMPANVFPSHRMLLTKPMESKSQQLRMRTSLRLGMSLPRKAPVLQYLLALTLTRTRLQVSQMVLAASRRQGARRLSRSAQLLTRLRLRLMSSSTHS